MEFITLGIGTPSDIPHFVLFGLSPTGPVALVAATADWIVQMPADDCVVVMPADDCTVQIPADEITEVM